MGSQSFPIYGHNRFCSLIKVDWKELQSVAAKADSLYKEFLNKKGRLIEEPVEPLKSIQKKIYNNILKHVELPPEFHGGIPKKSSLTNASFHLNKKVILKMDLKQCFRSISNAQVFRAWREFLGCSPTVSRIATRLTTYKGHLPQGTSASPMLANIVIAPAVMKITELCKQKGLKNTQFIDDANVSGNLINDSLITEMCKCFTIFGLRLNRSKIKIMRWGGEQIVTGLSTKKLNLRLPKSVRNSIRLSLFNLSKVNLNGRLIKRDCQRVRGKIEQLKNTHPQLYEEMLNQYKQIVS